MSSIVIRNAGQVVCVSQSRETAKRSQALQELAVLKGGNVFIRDGLVAWLGSASELPTLPPHTEEIDATGKVVLPGLVDSHTHLIFAGDRVDEFEQRLQGLTYQEIAAKGGGIN